MNARQHLQFQIVNLRRLLEQAKDDPIMEPQLSERLEDAEAELTGLTTNEGELFPVEEEPLPRAAVFLSGGGVHGQQGISPGLAAQALIQYEKMYTAQAIHDETVAARNQGKKRRPKGASAPELLFTGTPKGSFGLEFVPLSCTGAGAHGVHKESLRTLTETLHKANGLHENGDLMDHLAKVPPAVIKPMQQFFKHLAQYGAELRLALSDARFTKIPADQIRTLAERLDKGFTQDPVILKGTFRGVALDSGIFNFQPVDGPGIEGTAAEEMTEDELQHIHGLTNKEGEVELLRTTTNRVGATSTVKYVLLRGRGNDEPEFEKPEEG